MSQRGNEKSAQYLIQTLEDACTNMTDLAKQAEQEADEARHNAKLAMEIAQQYATRNYTHSNMGHSKEKTGTSWNELRPAIQTKSEQEHGNSKPNSVRKPMPSSSMNQPQSSDSSGRRPSLTKVEECSTSKEVVSLTLELERTKQALQNVTQELRAQHKLVTEYRQTITEKDAEISRLSQQVQVAEEDANMAMEVAKGSSDKREEYELLLTKALEENRILKEEQSKGLELVAIREAEEETEADDVSTNLIVDRNQHISNNAVSRGRGILFQYRNNNDALAIRKNKNTCNFKLQSLMQQNDAKFYLTSSTTIPKQPNSNTSVYNPSPLANQIIVKKLKESSEKLQFKLPKLTITGGGMEHAVLTYCNLVERKMTSQFDRIQELDSYCEFLERGLKAELQKSAE